MKKVSLMFFAFIFVFECFGQSGSKEVIYGTVRTDGYQKITKGAMWAIRPEAKVIYEGGHPAGYTIVVLDQDYFVRFVDGENNQFDRNYIVFPKGAIVYTDDKTNQFYSAICGNKIEYIRPVDMITIKTEQSLATDETNWVYLKPNSIKKQPYLPIPPIKEKKKQIKIGWVVISFATIVAIIGGLVIRSHYNDGYHRGNPGGAHSTRDEQDDTVEDPGGPGGSPTTTGD